MSINSIGTVNSLAPTKSLFDIQESQNTDYSKIPFADYLKNAMNDTNSLIVDAEKISNDFAAGRTDNIHMVQILAEKADTALQFTLQIRNKIMDAYSEIMRMQI